MPNRKQSRTTPRGEADHVHFQTEIGSSFQVVLIGSREWVLFLEEYTRLFSYKFGKTTITVRGETKQRGLVYWIAYKRIGRKMHKVYLGRPDKVTVEALQNAALKFEHIESLEKTQGK